MFDQDALHKRGQALEDEFFHRVDEELRARLRESMAREKDKQKLVLATGFKDEALLDHLLDAGFQSATVAALALVPAVFVAWADGKVTPQERQTVMSAALHKGFEREPSAFYLVEAWLNHRPPKSLWKLWKEYAAALYASLSPAMAGVLAQEILRPAKAVAESSRKTVGSGKVSKEEQEILDEVEEMSN
jgi:tellurite resistance protein